MGRSVLDRLRSAVARYLCGDEGGPALSTCCRAGQVALGGGMMKRRDGSAVLFCLGIALGACGITPSSRSTIATAPTTAAITTTASTDDVEEPLPPALWQGARTTRDGLVIAIAGGAPYRAGDYCTFAYDATVTESDTAVRVRIIARHPKRSGDQACPLVGQARIVHVYLERPLGSRQLFDDTSDRLRPVFDGSRLLEPSWLPDGWSLLFESAAPSEPSSIPYWNRVWGAPSGGIDAPCGISQVVLTEGRADLPDVLHWLDESEAGRYTVGENEAIYFAGGTVDETRLVWKADGMAHVLWSRPACLGDRSPSPDVLVHIANSLR